MQKKLIYDLPIRVFHWCFAGLFVFAFFIAKTIDDDSVIFSYHMLAGLMLTGLVILRLIWGLIGTQYARFSSFALHPKCLSKYIKEVFSGEKIRWSGHNPASSWITIIIIGLAIMLAITGILMTTGDKETFEDAHEFFANAFLVAVLLHIAGVFLHALRYQDGICFAMVDGKKEVTEGHSKISGSKPMFALLFIVVISILGTSLVKNFDTSTRELNFFGKTLSLGENEKEDENKPHHKKSEDEEDDD